MRLHCGQKCSSTGAPAPQLRHSSIDDARTGIGSGVIAESRKWAVGGGQSAGRVKARDPRYCPLPPAPCPLLCAEGTAAAAGRLRIRVVEHEALRKKCGVVVQRRAVEEQQALPVDEDLRAVRPLEDLVAQPRLAVPRERVAETGAPTALHAHTKT